MVSVLQKLAQLNMRAGLYTPKIREFCFLIGAMKSGTTTLYHYLAQHPQIAPNQHHKEPEYFSRESTPKEINRFLRQYMPNPLTRQIAIDASTGYTKQPVFPNVADRLTALPGKKHFIYMVRHPIDRLESHIAHNIANGEIQLLPDGNIPDITHHISVSKYAYQLDAYRNAFPETPIKILSFDRLKKEPLGLLRDVSKHLEIDPTFTFQELPPQNTRSRKANVQAFRLTPAQRDEINDRLRHDILRFRDEYGFDISSWKIT